jgi:hypothetical protein
MRRTLLAAALVALAVSGLVIYFHMYGRMRRRGTTGVRRVFW